MARPRKHLVEAAVLAASLVLSAVPGVSAASPPAHASSGGHVAPSGGGGGHHFGSAPRFEGGPRLEGAQRFGGMPRVEGGPRPGAGPRLGGAPPFEGGPRYEGGPRVGGRYAVPPHWVGMHPHFEAEPHYGAWVRPWGRTWVPHYWVGGYWGGAYWPHVYVDWDFPWFLGALPYGYATYWWGGVPYYYWQGVYYVWSPDYASYVVTDPPPVTGGVAEGATAPPAGQAGDSRGVMSLYVYPRKGQSQEQTDNDRYQCHAWAVGQTGFDPTDSSKNTGASTATPENYKRALTACLDARGYSVR